MSEPLEARIRDAMDTVEGWAPAGEHATEDQITEARQFIHSTVVALEADLAVAREGLEEVHREAGQGARPARIYMIAGTALARMTTKPT